jgi:hypothetical protein
VSKEEKKVFGPASKKQAMFLQSNADIIIYGGAMGKLHCPFYRKL